MNWSLPRAVSISPLRQNENRMFPQCLQALTGLMGGSSHRLADDSGLIVKLLPNPCYNVHAMQNIDGLHR